MINNLIGNFLMKNYLINGAIKADKIAENLQVPGKDHGTGGHSIFLGQVRDDIVDGKRVKGIEYSAYEEMVNKEIEKIKKIIFSEYDDVKEIEISHSIGNVEVGGISLFIRVSAGHRDHATLACRHALELIKTDLPVWKKEIFEDNSYRWLENG